MFLDLSDRGDASHFVLRCCLYSEQRTVLINFSHQHNCRRDIRTWEPLKKTWLEICCYQKQYRHSFRTVGDSLNEYILPSLNLTAFTKNRINFPVCFTYTIYFSEHVRLCQNNTSRKI